MNIRVNSNAWVKRRGTAEISARALELRTKAGYRDVSCIDVVGVLRRLESTELPGKGKLKIQVYPDRPNGHRAFVSFKPLMLHVERLTFERARWGTSYHERYILAHEIGHIILHDQLAVPFSGREGADELAVSQEEQAEAQANCFADYFLLPDHILEQHDTIEDLTFHCAISSDLARRRLSRKLKDYHSTILYDGEFCPECQNPKLTRRGLLLQCDVCGHSFPGL